MEYISEELLSRVLQEIYALLEKTDPEQKSVFDGVGLYPASCITEFETANHCKIRTSDYDTLVIPRLSCRDLGMMALGLFEDTTLEPAFSYLHGRDIYVIEEGIEYLAIKDMPNSIRAQFDGYLQTIRDGGVRVGKKEHFGNQSAEGTVRIEKGHTIDLTEKKLITNSDIPQDVSMIQVKKGVLFTPLAKDTVRDKKIKVLEI